jgi:hypothetical protein
LIKHRTDTSQHADSEEGDPKKTREADHPQIGEMAKAEGQQTLSTGGS